MIHLGISNENHACDLPLTLEGKFLEARCDEGLQLDSLAYTSTNDLILNDLRYPI